MRRRYDRKYFAGVNLLTAVFNVQCKSASLGANVSVPPLALHGHHVALPCN